MIIREAALADYDTVIDVWKQSWDSIGISNATDKAITWDMLRARLPEQVQNGWSLYVAETDAGIAGMLALELEDNHLDQLFVAPDAQSNGIGRGLLEHSKKLMPAEIWLSTAVDNVRACEWYEREGFQLERREKHLKFDRIVAYYRWKASD